MKQTNSKWPPLPKVTDILHASRVLGENVRVWLKARALKLNLLIAMEIIGGSVM
jgi:hypothetical protein